MNTIDNQFLCRDSDQRKPWARATRLRFACGALLALASCADGTDGSAPSEREAARESADQDELPVEHTLASLTVRGVEIRIFQTSPDNLVVLTKGATPDDPLADPEVHGMNVVEIYQHFAGKPAPAELAALPAAQRILTPRGAPAVAARSGGSDKHTNEAWRAEFCSGTHDVCETDVWWFEPYYEGRDQFIDGAINLINGDGVSVRVREERPVLGWRTITFFPVAVGEHWTWHSTSNGAYARRMTINVEGRWLDISQDGGYERSDRFHWMMNHN